MRKICLIYTGGTIGMKQNPNGKLAPVNFDELRASIPSLELLPIQLDVITVQHPQRRALALCANSMTATALLKHIAKGY